MISGTDLVIVDQLVHASRAEGGAHNVGDGHARIDVADQLRFSLTSVRALLEENDLRLLHRGRTCVRGGAV